MERRPGRRYNVHRMSTSAITWQDIEQLPDDGRRYEAIEGDLYVTAAPSFHHQRVSLLLSVALHGILEEPGHGIVVSAPCGVQFPSTGEGVQPDLLFISTGRRRIVGEAGVSGAPDLVIEILSPTTFRRDRGIKKRLYERQGVKEYWLVDIDAASVEVWRFGANPDFERYTESLPVLVDGASVGAVDLAGIFTTD